ncbi:MAG TPA: HAMP domain-containing sensor histidine kinase [bacterium]|nr:HAMP domain-containing sensor histidine kinase [bacterium]
MRSVRARLSAAFIGTALLTTVLTATFASYQARMIFRQYVERDQERGRGVSTAGGASVSPVPPDAPRRRSFGPREILFESRFRNAIWGGTLVAAGVGVLVALWLGSRIVKPVVILTQATRVIAGGGVPPLVPVTGRDELAELGHAFNRMASQLAEQETQRRRLFAGIAHELRTPLSVIQGTLEGMLDHVIEPTPERIAGLHSQSVLLKRLITDLRDLSLAQAGQLELHRRTTDVSGVVRETVEALAPLADERTIALRIEVPATLPEIQADPDRLRQVVQNLVENALRHTPAGGEVRIGLRDGNGEGIHLVVSDTGSGIRAEDLSHIFDHFYRADESRTRTSGGTGMGLAIVKSLVEAHGGHVGVESVPGTGSVFTVMLPKHAEEES